MTPQHLPERLARAAAVAAPPRSVVDDVLSRLPPGPPPVASRRTSWVIATAAGAGLAAVITFVLTLVGPSAGLTFAQMRVAFVQQRWVHVHYDAGQNRDLWTNLRTGEEFGTKQGFPFDGEVFYTDPTANVRRWYDPRGGVIQQDEPSRYRAGEKPPPWTAQTAWDDVVGPLERWSATTQPAGTAHTAMTRDTLNGRPVVRFDQWGTDGLGRPLLYAQLWADPATRLPVRVRERLQLGERDHWHKEWATGDYAFPATGPADLAAMGVPAGTPTIVLSTTAPVGVQAVLDAANRCSDDFLKHYRAVVFVTRDGSPLPIEEFDVVWRDDGRVRDNRYLVPFELQSHPTPPLTDKTPGGLVAWAAHHEAADMGLLADARVPFGREYSWISAAVRQGDRPQVHVTPHQGRHPLLSTNAWPEQIQWPMLDWGSNMELIPAGRDAPPGSIGLRWGGQGNQRMDYYVDPAQDFVCLKEVSWEKRSGTWCRTQELTLSDLRHVAGRVVAGVQVRHDFADPTRGIGEFDWTRRIDLQLVPPNDYPAGTFDPATLTTGADVVGF